MNMGLLLIVGVLKWSNEGETDVDTDKIDVWGSFKWFYEGEAIVDIDKIYCWGFFKEILLTSMALPYRLGVPLWPYG